MSNPPPLFFLPSFSKSPCLQFVTGPVLRCHTFHHTGSSIVSCWLFHLCIRCLQPFVTSWAHHNRLSICSFTAVGATNNLVSKYCSISGYVHGIVSLLCFICIHQFFLVVHARITNFRNLLTLTNVWTDRHTESLTNQRTDWLTNCLIDWSIVRLT